MHGLMSKQVGRLHASCGAAHGAMALARQTAIFAAAFLRALAILHLDFELRWIRPLRLRLADDHSRIKSIPILSPMCCELSFQTFAEVSQQHMSARYSTVSASSIERTKIYSHGAAAHSGLPLALFVFPAC